MELYLTNMHEAEELMISENDITLYCHKCGKKCSSWIIPKPLNECLKILKEWLLYISLLILVPQLFTLPLFVQEDIKDVSCYDYSEDKWLGEWKEVT